jgi:hypothetical protein
MDPFTIAAGISALGSAFKGITGFLGGNQQAKAEKAAAAQAEGEAGVAASQALAQGDQVAAQGAVQAAANGGGFVGSSIAAIQQLSSQAMFNARAAAYRGATEGRADLYQAKIAKGQGVSSLVGSLIGSAGDIAGGVARSGAESRQLAALTTLKGDAPPIPVG